MKKVRNTKKKKKETSNWCAISIPGFFLIFVGASVNNKIIGLFGFAIFVLGAIIWMVTYRPEQKKPVFGGEKTG